MTSRAVGRAGRGGPPDRGAAHGAGGAAPCLALAWGGAGGAGDAAAVRLAYGTPKGGGGEVGVSPRRSGRGWCATIVSTAAAASLGCARGAVARRRGVERRGGSGEGDGGFLGGGCAVAASWGGGHAGGTLRQKRWAGIEARIGRESSSVAPHYLAGALRAAGVG